MEKTIEATGMAHHSLFYMENASGTHSTAMPPTLISDEQIAGEHQPSCFALEEEKGADWKGRGAAGPIINEVEAEPPSDCRRGQMTPWPKLSAAVWAPTVVVWAAAAWAAAVVQAERRR
jgi:hypothetical protein